MYLYLCGESGNIELVSFTGKNVFQSDKVFLFQNDTLRRIYIWNGSTTSPRHKYAAARTAAQLRAKYGHVYRIITIDEYFETQEFSKDIEALLTQQPTQPSVEKVKAPVISSNVASEEKLLQSQVAQQPQLQKKPNSVSPTPKSSQVTTQPSKTTTPAVKTNAIASVETKSSKPSIASNGSSSPSAKPSTPTNDLSPSTTSKSSMVAKSTRIAKENRPSHSAVVKIPLKDQKIIVSTKGTEVKPLTEPKFKRRFMRNYDLMISVIYVIIGYMIITYAIELTAGFDMSNLTKLPTNFLIIWFAIFIIIISLLRGIIFRRIKYNLEDKVVIVTGASSGIGESVVKKLAYHHAKVILVARSVDKMEEIVAEIKSKYPSFECLIAQTDVTDQVQVKNMVINVIEKYNRIDILINCAGAGVLGTISEIAFSDMKKCLDLDFMSIAYLTQMVTPIMMKNSLEHKIRGQIINISSSLSCHIVPGFAFYTIAKRAVVVLTKACAIDLDKDGIKVSCVLPGPYRTAWVKNIIAGHYSMSFGFPVSWVSNKIIAMCLYGRSQTKVFDNVIMHLFGNMLSVIGCFSTSFLMKTRGFIRVK